MKIIKQNENNQLTTKTKNQNTRPDMDRKSVNRLQGVQEHQGCKADCH